MERVQLQAFVRESNRIEGILRDPTRAELDAHEVFLSLRTLTVEAVEGFVQEVAAASLRDREGMNVRVGNHRPPPGGLEIRKELEEILLALTDGSRRSPYESHVHYEQLHPFMDGNGRSGRAIWAWHMKHVGLDPFALPFLHRFYYQALDASRA